MADAEDAEGLVVIAPGEAEVLGDAPDRRVELLSARAPLPATWSRFGPGREGADLHVHHEHSDAFFVLDGELTLRLGAGGHEVALRTGGLVRIPPGVVHGFRNATDGELRYLNLHTPGVGFAAYLRAIRDGRPSDFDQHDPPPDGGRATGLVTVGPAAGAVAETTRAQDADGATAMYVLEGELTVAGTPAPAGTWVTAPRDVAGDARALVVRV